MANKKKEELVIDERESEIDTPVIKDTPKEETKKELDLIPIFLSLPESEISDLKSKISAYMKMEVNDFRYLLGQSLTNILKNRV